MSWEFYFITFGLLILSNLLLLQKTGTWFNPYTILSVFYFTPMIFATMRLSGLQSNAWDEDTILILIMSVLVWGPYPFLMLWYLGKKSNHEKTYNNNRLEYMSPLLIKIIVALSFLFIVAYLLENYMLSSSLFPIWVVGSLAHEVHIKSIFALNNITGASSSMALLLFFVYTSRKRKWLLLLLCIVVFIPITRGSRLHVFAALIGIGIMNAELQVFTLSKWKVLFIGAPTAIVITLLFSGVGVIRSSFRGEIDFSYARNLDLKIKGGLFDSIAYMYGYFPLNFENLDRVVRNNPQKRLWGQFSMMPLTSTFLPAKMLFDDCIDPNYMDNFRHSVTPTGVCTSLAYFYMDFGAVGAGFPMFIYMSFWIFLFRNRNRCHIALLMYSLYSGYFSLASFQALMIHPATFRKMIFVALPFIIAEVLNKSVLIRSIDKV